MRENPGSSAIDRSVLEQIRMLEGPGREGLLEKVIALYLSDSTRLMDKIRASAEAADAEALRRSAHTLKSSSANVGATGIFEICRKIEERMAAGSPPSLDDPQLERLAKEYASVRRELEAMIGSGSGEDKGGA